MISVYGIITHNQSLEIEQHKRLAQHYKSRYITMQNDQRLNGAYNGYKAIDYHTMYYKYLLHKRQYTTKCLIRALDEHIADIGSISKEIQTTQYMRVLKMSRKYTLEHGYNKVPDMIETWLHRFNNTPKDEMHVWSSWIEVFDFVSNAHHEITPIW